MSHRLLPTLPAKHCDFIEYISNKNKPVAALLQPYHAYEETLRQLFAQEPGHPALADSTINLVPLFDNAKWNLLIRARDLDNETADQKAKYVMPLSSKDRRLDRSSATVMTFDDFNNQFNVFSEGALVGIDWTNVVVSGSAVTTCLLPVPRRFSHSKRALRTYYHEKIAPASDVDLFLYGLDEAAAAEKIKQIESSVRNTILAETVTIRTKNAITIASQYPNRHIQVVLRCYKSISEVLTGFDVDCSCVAFDGKQVYASPRALAAFATQCNTIDLSRRSPSYENRLAKYANRGFEIFCPSLQRDKIDPTIFERAFSRTVGLARLLVLEKLPKSTDRENYMDQRRSERGRPPISPSFRANRNLRGDLKADALESAEWLADDEVSNYHTFTIPYGPRFNAMKIGKLLYTKDLLLNAEWNRPKDRVRLHRHPAFFGVIAQEAMADCCEHCPEPENEEERMIAEEESKSFVSSSVCFLKDDPGRQSIGSFHPTTENDWTEMAYVSNTARLFQAIVDSDVEAVQQACTDGGPDLNQRDYCGRTPLHVATSSSSLAVVRLLIDRGARLTPRLADGKNVLHLASARGDVSILRAILDKNEANEAEKLEAEDADRAMKKVVTNGELADKDRESQLDDETHDISEQDAEDSVNGDAMTEGSFVKVRGKEEPKQGDDIADDDASEPDVFDINAPTFDQKATSLHYAIINGNDECAKTLVSDYGADPLLPLKLLDDYNQQPKEAIIPLVLATRLPSERMVNATVALLSVGATAAQTDNHNVTALQYFIAAAPEGLDAIFKCDGPAAKRALNHLIFPNDYYRGIRWDTGLTIAIKAGKAAAARRLLKEGCEVSISMDAFRRTRGASANKMMYGYQNENEQFRRMRVQPVILAVQGEHPDILSELLDYGADCNTINGYGYDLIENPGCGQLGLSLLDIVREKLEALKKPKGDDLKAPDALNSDDHYLQGFGAETYRRWRAYNDLQQAKKDRAAAFERFLVQKEAREARTARPEKQTALNLLVQSFETVEAKLVSIGAKTFKDLHPDLAKPYNDPNTHHIHQQPAQKHYATEFCIWNGYNMKIENGGHYTDLFEAAWLGDLETIKRMTLQPWGTHSENDPLEVASTDAGGFSVFSLAMLRGHDTVARAVLEISRAQFEPPEGERRRYNVTVGRYHNNVSIESEVVNDQFTSEVLAGVASQVKSCRTPISLLMTPCNAFDFDDRTNQSELSDLDRSCRYSLFQYAIHKGEYILFDRLLELEKEFALPVDEKQSFSRHFNDYLAAVNSGRIPFLKTLLKTGAGLALDAIMEKTGAEVHDRPEFYQGLNVRGKKRKDWAKAPNSAQSRMKNSLPPLLEASKSEGLGALKSCEFMSSNEPERLYAEFATSNAEEKRLATVLRVPGGIAPVIESFLYDRRLFALHCAISAEPVHGAKIVAFFLSLHADSLNLKNCMGRTPLEFAFQLLRVDAAKHLIEHSADQACRNKSGDNLLHVLFTPSFNNAGSRYREGIISKIKSLVALLKTDRLPAMLIERSSTQPGSVTPIARFLGAAQWCYNKVDGEHTVRHLEALQLLLSLSREHAQDADLDIVDGAGDTPLHSAVKLRLYEHVRAIAQHKPSLLHRENATGQTPIETAKEAYLYEMLSEPPSLYPSAGTRNQRYYYESSWQSKSLADMTPDEFAKRQNRTAWDGMSDVERTWRVCDEVAEKNANKGIKRKLVTLFDANEVAKRLARRSEETRLQQTRSASAYSARRPRGFFRQRHGWRGMYGNEEQVLDEVENILREKT